MKKVLVLLAGMLFVFFLVSDVVAKTKWDLHLNYPAGNFHSKGAQRFADKVHAGLSRELDKRGLRVLNCYEP